MRHAESGRRKPQSALMGLAGGVRRLTANIRLNTYRGIAPNFRCPYGTACVTGPNGSLSQREL